MLAVLDPGLFQTALSVAELQKLVQVLRPGSDVRLAAANPYWSKFVRQVLRPASTAKHADRHYQAMLDQFLAAARDARGLQLCPPPSRVAVWGFRQLFDCCGATWTDDMVEWLARCVVSGEPTILLTRLQLGRNAQLHGSDHVQLIEKTVWNLRLKPDAGAVVQVWCIREPRNISVRSSCRFDEGLPDAGDGSAVAFPFRPPANWHKRSCKPAIQTGQSKPAWIDEDGNAWAKPNTPGDPHHWDVYLVPKHSKEFGLNQINVVRYGSPPQQGSPGSIHHVPKSKRSRIKK